MGWEEFKNKSEDVDKKDEISENFKNLKSQIINDKLNSLELSQSSKQVLDILQNKPDGTKTNMYKKLEELEWDDFNIEKFTKDIDNTVKKYLYQGFIDWKWEFKIDDKVIDSMSVWIQFSMMKTLSISWKDWSKFFDGFSKIKTDGFSNIFDWLFDVLKWNKWIFGKVWKLNESVSYTHLTLPTIYSV